MPHEDYLTLPYGIRSWLLTTDHKRIALLYLGLGDVLLFPRRHLRHDDPHSSSDPNWRPGYAGKRYNKLFTCTAWP